MGTIVFFLVKSEFVGCVYVPFYPSGITYTRNEVVYVEGFGGGIGVKSPLPGFTFPDVSFAVRTSVQVVVNVGYLV